MLQQSLQFIQTILDQFLRTKFGLTDECVVINNVINTDGTVPRNNQNKMVVSLLNIEQETNKQFYGRTQKLSNGNFADRQPFERYNLDILFSSSFDDYSETLKFLNATLEFFQANAIMDRGNYSTLPKGINKLDVDIEHITYHQMHSLWSAMGAKYQPSIIYKLRLISIQSNDLVSILPQVTQTANSVQS